MNKSFSRQGLCECIFQTRKEVPQPKSPDPDIPEWDWDDTTTKSEKVLYTFLL